MSRVYPKAILDRLKSPKRKGYIARANAAGKSAAFECGTYLKFELTIEPESKLIESIAFRSNGCGYMIASAEILAEEYQGKYLTALHSLKDEPYSLLAEGLGAFPSERKHCRQAVISALKNAFGDFRRWQIEEFVGEKTLICTCFGVTEETIELIVKDRSATSVGQVGQICNAGTGCGSCQFMIQGIIDDVTSGS